MYRTDVGGWVGTVARLDVLTGLCVRIQHLYKKLGSGFCG
jgi:hypothetical protein